MSAAILFALSSDPAARSGRGAGSVLAILSVLLPLADLELCLRPFAELRRKQTNLFVSDPELGWRLRPGADAQWGNVRVTINASGLRGPLVPYERDESSLRILYLGDSVALVVFPDLLQFKNIAKLDQPQRILLAHAQNQGCRPSISCAPWPRSPGTTADDRSSSSSITTI